MSGGRCELNGDLSQLWLKDNAKIPRRYLFIEADWNNITPNRVSNKIADNIKNADLNLISMPGKSNVGNIIVDDIKRGVRYNQYKLCYDRLTKQMQLYDLENDPNEKIEISSENGPMVDLMFLCL